MDFDGVVAEEEDAAVEGAEGVWEDEGVPMNTERYEAGDMEADDEDMEETVEVVEEMESESQTVDEMEEMGEEEEMEEDDSGEEVSVMDFVHQQLQETEVSWPNDNWRIWSQMLSFLNVSDAVADRLLMMHSTLDPTLPSPEKLSQLRKIERDRLISNNFEIIDCPIAPPLFSGGVSMVEDGRICVIVKDILEQVVEILVAPENKGNVHFHSECAFGDVDGLSRGASSSPVVDELYTARWWFEQENELLKIRGAHRPRILAIGMASDALQITMTDRKLHPVYVFPFNIPHHLRTQQTGWGLNGFREIPRW